MTDRITPLPLEENKKLVIWKDGSFKIVDESWEYEGDADWDATVDLGAVEAVYIHPKRSPYHSQVFKEADMQMDNPEGKNEFLNECVLHIPAHSIVQKLNTLAKLEALNAELVEALEEYLKSLRDHGFGDEDRKYTRLEMLLEKAKGAANG